MANPAGSFIWYELITPDPDGAKAFYDSVVGWTIADSSEFPNGYRMIGRSDGGNAGGLLPLNEEMREHGARPVWLAYLNVEDVDEAVDRVRSLGGQVHMEPFDTPGVGRMAMVTEPAGAPFYVMKPIPPEGQENASSDVFSTSEDQRVGWNELASSDPDGACRFFGELFGWKTDDFMPMGEHGEYRFIDHHGERLGAIFKVFDGDTPGWRFYIRVPSIGAAVERVKAGGGTVTMGPHEVPGGDSIIIGTDPQGARFALVGKA